MEKEVIATIKKKEEKVAATTEVVKESQAEKAEKTIELMLEMVQGLRDSMVQQRKEHESSLETIQIQLNQHHFDMADLQSEAAARDEDTKLSSGRRVYNSMHKTEFKAEDMKGRRRSTGGAYDKTNNSAGLQKLVITTMPDFPVKLLLDYNHADLVKTIKLREQYCNEGTRDVLYSSTIGPQLRDRLIAHFDSNPENALFSNFTIEQLDDDGDTTSHGYTGKEQKPIFSISNDPYLGFVQLLDVKSHIISTTFKAPDIDLSKPIVNGYAFGLKANVLLDSGNLAGDLVSEDFL